MPQRGMAFPCECCGGGRVSVCWCVAFDWVVLGLIWCFRVFKCFKGVLRMF